MSSKTYTKSQQAILDAAKACFWKYGISRVTVEEICEVAGVSKMTFYRTFENKQEVAKIVLTAIIESGDKSYDSIMQLDITFPQKIKQLIKLEHELSKGISNDFLNDIVNNEDGELNQLMKESQMKGQSKILTDLKKAQEEGWVRKDLKLSFIFHMMNDINAKLQDPKLQELYDSTDGLVMDLVNHFFYGIIATPTE